MTPTLQCLTSLGLLLSACGSPAPPPPPPPPIATLSTADMLAYLTTSYCPSNPALLPSDACADRRPQTEHDPAVWRRHDWGGKTGPAAGWQISDAVLATRSGKQFIELTFDFGGPAFNGSATWGVFDTIDGADLLMVGPTSAGAFHSRDGGPANSAGTWLLAPDCVSPGWLMFGNDVSVATHSVVAMLGAQTGGNAITGCPPGFVPAYTEYHQATDLFAFARDGKPMTLPVDAIVSTHYGGASPATTLNGVERFWFGRDPVTKAGWGKLRWSAWAPPTPANLSAAVALTAGGWLPPMADDTPPIAGWVEIAGRQWTNIIGQPAWTVVSFGWPAAGFVP